MIILKIIVSFSTKKNTADDRYLREMLNIYKYLVQHQINYIDGFLPGVGL